LRILGLYSLYFAHALAVWGVVVALITIFKNDSRALKSVERTVFSIFVLTSMAVAALLLAFIKDDFTIRYVYEYSRRAQPLIYKLSALWGGMDGSLLFWEWLLALYAWLAIRLGRAKIDRLVPFASLILFLAQGFFLFLMTFKTNPFTPLLDPSQNPVTGAMAAGIDGNGLNPLLQNFYMAIHPPLLYLGFVGFTIPFAFVLAVLWEKEVKPLWLPVVRYWSLYSWLTLGMGIIFGSYWAYIELGWGGYWAWDPVENASLMPWLTGTAFLHSLFMEKKRGMFKAWNVFLISATFILSIYGTYLTRSGILQSVHSFGQEDPSIPWYFQLGNIFLGFMGMILLVSIGLSILRNAVLKPGAELESPGSKESMVFYANILFSLFTVVVLYGVSSPIFYKIFTGNELHNGIEFYNPKAIPVTLALLLVMSIASVAPWRKGGFAALRKGLLVPSIIGIIGAICGTIFLYTQHDWWQVLCSSKKALFYFIVLFALSFFSLSVIAGEYIRGVLRIKAKTNNLVLSLFLPFRENPRRYGGYTVHMGIIVFCVGVAFSSMFQKNFQEELKSGEAFKAGGITFSLSRLDHDDLRTDLNKVNDLKIWADVDLFKNGKYLGTLSPMRVHYKNTMETGQPPAYEVAIRTSLFQDIYIVLSGFDTTENFAVIGVYINPLVAFLWLGGLIILLGGIIALLPPGKMS
jgi:cytochrome c-type biogenesis protein CcmF